jgi:beta-N-acetylhexosaminidase
MLDVNPDNPTSLALHRFLAERPDLFQQKRLIVFSFNAPTYLDATNIAKLTAYYGLYSKTPNFIDVAARLLFREIRPIGSLPISVPGVGYDLISATMPDPDQVIPLQLDLPSPTSTLGTATPEAAPTPEYQVGNSVLVRTGVIFDHNEHPVPDGTPVQFISTIDGNVNALPQVETTINGIARTTIPVNGSGTLEIRVESEPAKQSTILQFEIPNIEGGATPTSTEHPTETATPSPSPTIQPIPSAPSGPPPLVRPHLQDWFIAVVITVFISLISYRLAALIGQVRWGVRSGFLALIGGLGAYTYLAVGLPGSDNVIHSAGAWGIILVTLLGCAGGILTAWGWRLIRLGPKVEG